MTTLQALRDEFLKHGKKFPLTNSNGFADGYFIADGLARGLHFSDQPTALALASAMVLVNNAMTYLEHDPKHPYNRNFINGFITAMREIDAVAAKAGIKTVVLPHSFGYFAHREFKAIREHVAQWGIQKEMRLPSGVIVKFRDRPYSLDLSSFGKLDTSKTLLIPVPGKPGDYRTDVKIGTLFSSNSRGMASASDHIKHIWDMPAYEEGYTPPRQLSFKLNDPNAQPEESLLASINKRQAAEAQNRSFLTGMAPA